jgi:hypothetical protein
MKWMLIALSAVSMLLAGCGTSSQVKSDYARASSDRFTYEVVNTDGMSDEGLSILKARIEALLAERGQRAAGTEVDAKKVTIEITNYYMRHGATRAMVGIMAGRDNIESDVRILDASGKVLGQIDVSSFNSTAWGTSRGLIEGHAEEIVEFATGAKAM